jgi:integrase
MATIEKRDAKSGKVTYRALVRLKGFPSQSATFDRLTDARSWARNTESAIKEGRHFKTAEAKRRTFTELVERYLKRVRQDNPERLREVKPQMEWWKQELGYCTLADLSKSLISEKIEKLSQRTRKLKDGTEKRISPARVNRYIAALSHACTIAVNEWEWLEQHPVRKIKRKQEPRGRVRFLDDEERARLLTACKDARNPALYIIVVLALSTGARRGELEKLKWKDVDFNRGVIVLHETKNDERRVLPLAGHALELLKAHSKVRRIDSAFVFPSKTNAEKPLSIQTAWKNALENTGIEDFRFHDLRHSAASYLAMNGATLAEIAEVLGHKTLQMVKRYAHLSEAHTSSVVASMNERIFGDV